MFVCGKTDVRNKEIHQEPNTIVQLGQQIGIPGVVIRQFALASSWIGNPGVQNKVTRKVERRSHSQLRNRATAAISDVATSFMIRLVVAKPSSHWTPYKARSLSIVLPPGQARNGKLFMLGPHALRVLDEHWLQHELNEALDFGGFRLKPENHPKNCR